MQILPQPERTIASFLATSRIHLNLSPATGQFNLSGRPQHCLNLRPLPQGQGSLRFTLGMKTSPPTSRKSARYYHRSREASIKWRLVGHRFSTL